MKTIKYMLFSILILLGACVPKNQNDTELSNAKLSSTLDSLGQTILDEGKVLGFSISIDSSGKTIYNRGFGFIDAEQTKPVTRQTRFDIASVSKLVGVTVVMKLIEQGKLNLNQTLDELLPEFPNIDQARRIKLKHLISHTSGLQDYALEIDSLFMQTGIIPEKKDFLDFFHDKNLVFDPGSNYQYSNSGFMLMAFISESITNKSWQQLIDEFINKPSALDFQLIKHASKLPQTSPIFNLDEGEFKEVPTWVYVFGDGGLTATSEMLSKFPLFWANDDMLDETSLKNMITPKSLKDSTRSGYGFGVRNGEFLGEPLIGHTGGWKSTYAMMTYFPERNITFAGVMNTDGTPRNMNSIFAAYMLEFLNKDIPDYSNSDTSIERPERFIGEYHGYDREFDNTGTTITIKLNENGKLVYCMGDYCEPMYSIGQDKFWIKEFPFDYIEFQMDELGNSQAIREYYFGFFQVLRKKTN